MSSRIARDASPSSAARASGSGIFQIRAAVVAVTGLIGSCATSPVSRSLNSICRIWKSNSDGGAPCGNRFSRSESAWYAWRVVTWAMATIRD
jgi:hypothetical protein